MLSFLGRASLSCILAAILAAIGFEVWEHFLWDVALVMPIQYWVAGVIVGAIIGTIVAYRGAELQETSPLTVGVIGAFVLGTAGYLTDGNLHPAWQPQVAILIGGSFVAFLIGWLVVQLLDEYAIVELV